MAYVCGNCEFYDAGGEHTSKCPTCGGRMRMTLLEPRVTATATLEPPKKAEWTDTYAYGYEEIEAPWSFRYAQIGIGISTFFVASRLLIAVIVLPMAIAMRDTPREKSLIVLGAASL
ncbi:MAG TPA: hypothetical protein VHV08_03505, partial [Pirellulales bacterium]|nr:hypothetical protein [Pirellulales bacterium]